MRKVFLTKRFQKSFKKLDKKTQTRVKDAIEVIREDPQAGKVLTGSLAGDYFYRVGNYRIVYLVEAENIWLETVKNRREVYKKRKK